MVALKSERHVFMWHISPHPVPQDAPVDVTLAQILAILEKEYKGGRAFAHLDSDGQIVSKDKVVDAKNCIFIADLKKLPKENAWVILITRGDPDAAHPSFINPVALTVKDVRPGADEVQGWSAHLIIRDDEDGRARHRACFERMQGVSSTLVQRFLDALIDAATDGDPSYTYQKALKKGKKTKVEERPYKLRLGVNKVPSENLKRDIERGVLSQITLIKSDAEYGGPGDPTTFNSVKQELVIRPKRVDANAAYDLATRIAAWGKSNDYSEVQFRIDSLPGDTSASPRFDLEKADAMETLYSRSKRIVGFATILATCYQAANEEICAKMTAELTTDTNW